MRRVILIPLLAMCLATQAQFNTSNSIVLEPWYSAIPKANLQGIHNPVRLTSYEKMLNEHFFVDGFDSRLPLFFNKKDTVTLKRGVQMESLRFTKKGKLKMVTDWQWCGNTFIFERIYNSIFGRIDYHKSWKGSYLFYPEKDILYLQFGSDEYYCEILDTKLNGEVINSIKIKVVQKNPRQNMLR